jgi:F0F1-type ATP synthase membrane subunit b/b'
MNSIDKKTEGTVNGKPPFTRIAELLDQSARHDQFNFKPFNPLKMKKLLLALAASTFITGAILTGCSTPAQKVENAQNDVKEANKDLDKANEEYLEDIKSYRKETSDRIAANDKSIAEFNARIEHEKKDAKDDYKKRIAGLELRNSDMKKRMDDYKAEGKEKWEKFKVEFSHDLDEVGKAFKDLTVKNVK